MKVKASAIRKVGSAMKLSISRASSAAPGKGTKERIRASTKPSARQPALAAKAISTVCRMAPRNIALAKTSPQGLQRKPARSTGEGLAHDQGQGVEEAADQDQQRRHDPQRADVDNEPGAPVPPAMAAALSDIFGDQRGAVGGEMHRERRARERRLRQRGGGDAQGRSLRPPWRCCAGRPARAPIPPCPPAHCPARATASARDHGAARRAGRRRPAPASPARGPARSSAPKRTRPRRPPSSSASSLTGRRLARPRNSAVKRLGGSR